MAKSSNKVAVIEMPRGEKIGNDGEIVALSAEDVRLLSQGWDIKMQIGNLEKALAEINASLIKAHGAGVSLIVPGVCRASIAEREGVKIKDAERLKAILGGRFGDLVKTVVDYKPEQRLVEMACDGDEPLQPAIGACLTVSKGTSVTWRAEK
jgi:hypothetical protein